MEKWWDERLMEAQRYVPVYREKRLTGEIRLLHDATRLLLEQKDELQRKTRRRDDNRSRPKGDAGVGKA